MSPASEGLRPASEGLNSPPGYLTRGSAPEPRWGLHPQTTVIGSRSALAIVPSKLNSSLCSTKFFLKYALFYMTNDNFSNQGQKCWSGKESGLVPRQMSAECARILWKFEYYKCNYSFKKGLFKGWLY